MESGKALLTRRDDMDDESLGNGGRVMPTGDMLRLTLQFLQSE
jgi:hypothetical protein